MFSNCRVYSAALLVLLFPALCLAQGSTAPTTAATAPAASVTPLLDRGLYAIWFKDEAKTLALPFIKGGQMVFQWGKLHPASGKFDFSEMDAMLKHYNEIGRKATIQVNGNEKPQWLFEKVAVLEKSVSEQTRDKQGALQYWDPIFANAYREFILAYGEHLRQSPYKNAVLGVRLNFNALGTEHGAIPEDKIPLDNWKPAPNGHIHNVPWSKQVWAEYKHMVVKTFVEAFRPEIMVFVRNNVFNENVLTPEQIGMLERGELGLFHTSTEIQPRGEGGEKQYGSFIKYCKSGMAPGYAESWADAWGVHGSITDPRPFAPPQWNYWRLLADLHCGVSYIAIYGTDLENAGDPEFRAAFEFANKYAGYHASPEVSPGAFVAFRDGDFLKGDYTFLAERDVEKSADVAVAKQGPDDQRYGQWARQIDGGEGAGRIQVNLDTRFAKSLENKPALLRVIYLDEGTDSFTINYCGAMEKDGAMVPAARSKSVTKKDTKRWQECVIEIPQANFSRFINNADIVLSGQGKHVFHMVEVQRK